MYFGHPVSNRQIAGYMPGASPEIAGLFQGTESGIPRIAAFAALIVDIYTNLC